MLASRSFVFRVASLTIHQYLWRSLIRFGLPQANVPNGAAMRTKSEYSDGANTWPGGLGANQKVAIAKVAMMEPALFLLFFCLDTKEPKSQD